MDLPSAASSSVEPEPTEGPSLRDLTENALEANKVHQNTLLQYSDRLRTELQELEKLIDAVSISDDEDEPEAGIEVPGAHKAVGPYHPPDFLNPEYPFFEEASRRTQYLNEITPRPMKARDLELLAEAVRSENQRLQAFEMQKKSRGLPSIEIDLDHNTEGLDWNNIAEKVSSISTIERTADQCRIKWLGERHPKFNHGDWAAEELSKLSELITAQVQENSGKVDWTYVVDALGTNRTPLDCMRRAFPRQRHTWNHISDQKLFDAVQLYGTDNWGIVARIVSEDATAAQCQGRYSRALDPRLKRGAWSEAELARLKVAVEAYGNNWIGVASCIPGRTNEQCRERWSESLSASDVKSGWTAEEDAALLEAVSTLGNQWKAISIKLGNGKRSTQCRLRHDKLKKLDSARSGKDVVPSTSRAGQGSGVSASTRKAGTQQTGNATSDIQSTVPSAEEPAAEAPPKAASKSRPKPRPTGKGKAKAIDQAQTAEATPVPPTAAGPTINVTDTGTSPTQRKKRAGDDLEDTAPTKKKRASAAADQSDAGPRLSKTNTTETPIKKTRAPRKGQATTTEGPTSQPETPGQDMSIPAPKTSEVGATGSNSTQEGRSTFTLRIGARRAPENIDPVASHVEEQEVPTRTSGRPRKGTIKTSGAKKRARTDDDGNTSPINTEPRSAEKYKPKPRPRDRPKTTGAPTEAVTDTSPDEPADNHPRSSPAPPTPYVKRGRRKAADDTTPQDNSRRQSARVAARKSLVEFPTDDGPPDS